MKTLARNKSTNSKWKYVRLDNGDEISIGKIYLDNTRKNFVFNLIYEQVLGDGVFARTGREIRASGRTIKEAFSELRSEFIYIKNPKAKRVRDRMMESRFSKSIRDSLTLSEKEIYDRYV